MTLAAIALLLTLILAVRMHAFLALLVASLALGVAAGMPPAKILKAIQTGAGDALGFIAIVVALGSIIGRFIEHSGGGRRLAEWLLARFGDDRANWAVLISAFLVGLPVFFEVGFVILAPLVWNMARGSKRSLLFYGLPLAAAMTILHALVPPHPAPAVATQLMGADLGKSIVYGIILSIPLSILGGIVFGGWASLRIFPPLPAIAANQASATGSPPPIPIVVALLVLPVALIFAGTMFRNPATEFVGHPFTALLITVFAAMWALGLRRGLDAGALTRLATESLGPAASLLLIIGAGGAFKQVIVDCGVAPYAGGLLARSHISPLIVCFVTAAGLRAAQGSATVAIVTAAGILAPLMKAVTGTSPELMMLAVCCGGSSLGHVNDAGFWLVKEYLGMTVGETLRSWTVMKILMSSAGILLLLAAQLLGAG